MTGTFEVEYVVQVKQEEGAGPDDRHDAWVDVATVTVPARTKRRTVVEKGLADAGVEKTPELEARLLDPAAAYVWRAKPPEPASLRLS
jgi:hypothetical protein